MLTERAVPAFALVLLLRSTDLALVDPEVFRRMPRRGLAAVMPTSGTLTALVWLEPILTSLVAGSSPRFLMHSTTLVTEVLDLAIVAPAALVAGVLLLGTAFQLRADREFIRAELVGPIAGFVAATWLGY